ncbi:MAG: tyrosine-type recombinase/integrase [Gammaproteobacteria bacterium]|jgi:site-specific recombinase XerD|nr:tyrosine-type recombinase/integrase [Gammaproteobacteria bacterium]
MKSMNRTNRIDTRHNQNNEIVKRKFFEELEHAKNGKDPKTVDQYMKAIHEFEVATGFKDFNKFSSDWAVEFKNYLEDKINRHTGEPISKSFYFNYLSCVREFFTWLVANEKAYKKIKLRHIEYFYPTRNDKNKAKATGYQECYLLSDILATIRNMSNTTEIELRNRAMISLCLLTTPRISALQTARLQSIKYFKQYDLWAFVQDPRLLNTKFAKKITAFFIGQVPDLINNVISWREHLVAEGFTGKDFLFPKISSNFTSDNLSAKTLTRERIKSQSVIRDIFKTAFMSNGLPYYKPHSFRHSLARAIKKAPNAVELSIALAENMGHKGGLSTLHASYGGDYEQQQSAILKAFKLG